MDVPTSIPPGFGWEQWLSSLSARPAPYLLVFAFLIVAISYMRERSRDQLKRIPYLNAPQFYSSIGAKHGEALIAQARQKYARLPYRFLMDIGEVVVLPPEFIDEIRNEPNLSFGEAFKEDFHSNIPGLEPMSQLSGDQLVQSVLRKYLVKVTPEMTRRVSEEAASAIPTIIGGSLDWHEVTLHPTLLALVSRVSSRIFLGDELCRSEEWLQVIKTYSKALFVAAAKLHIMPRPLRRIASWLIPELKVLRAQIKEAERIFAPVIARRQEMRHAAIANGWEVPKFDDALGWLEREATAKGLVFDAALVAKFEIVVVAVALHTTIDLVQQSMIELAQRPETMQQIRDEVIYHLRAEGLSRASLYKMSMLDSALKETQRMKPIETVMLRRRVMGDVHLSSGLTLKEGMRTWVSTCRMRDPGVYENPDQWDANRFLKLRSQPGWENTTQLVSTSRDHYAFGYGEHACPGRFFAANEIKVLFCHLLVNYEWKLAPGVDVRPKIFGIAWVASQDAKLSMRRREKAEFDFGSVWDAETPGIMEV
ncbi:cytochrome P450 [Durotheca rogersii]|uniref:cytochrome P450 n=1 Tax=Durotheca rogersii TaxID=419775 RepID=UPI0022204718|nr:cytochrome P450 [Durotheca rogersii]KAI5858276.1 cytochrome P450 [Durotheca rogersii]